MSGEVGRRRIATCVGCGCTDIRACRGGCWWLEVDYDKGEGLCSNCRGKRR